MLTYSNSIKELIGKECFSCIDKENLCKILDDDVKHLEVSKDGKFTLTFADDYPDSTTLHILIRGKALYFKSVIAISFFHIKKNS